MDIVRVKTLTSNLVRMTRFWSNLHQVRSKSKGWKSNVLKSFGSK